MKHQEKSPKDLLFIVPMKDPKRAKSRLSNVLTDGTRQRLALTLYRQTLTFLTGLSKQAGCDFGILVVTNSQPITNLASDFGVGTLQQSDEGGLNAAVAAGCDWATAHDYRSVCILPADLADHDSKEYLRLLSCARTDRSIIICPSQDQGTNALMITPPNALPFCYGAQSFHRHLEEAEHVGLLAVILPLEGISHDIDSANDLARPVSSAIRNLLKTRSFRIQEARS
ncbi:2-phospho-L-lactate guanylyltransferase [Cohaesibacter gelatinilyticus]|uniref:3-phospho-D-glycerate guanylyltransferase n=1 Tax=Cohaesibacter gelatinilyticus TaxID=372072 RepID=A0A285PEY0_9HYPH|nr:2-phospho-L-lactate guanylyltransferase [Cohaesibacter gelatinilyticus]SNZ20279.1 2-phospho-L-lactate guanylyltransferase [Cohaesibacter gelatinilyticus]